MPRLKTFAQDVKDHVKRQKYAYGFALCAVVLLNGNLRNSRHFSEFLQSKDIDPLEFWNPEWFNELKKD